MSRMQNVMAMIGFLDSSGLNRNGKAMQEATVS